MAKCDKIAKCPFFDGRLAHYVPAIVESMKREYCNGDFGQCARYRVFQELGKDHVPGDMSPVDQERADEILAKKRVSTPTE